MWGSGCISNLCVDAWIFFLPTNSKFGDKNKNRYFGKFTAQRKGKVCRKKPSNHVRRYKCCRPVVVRCLQVDFQEVRHGERMSWLRSFCQCLLKHSEDGRFVVLSFRGTTDIGKVFTCRATISKSITVCQPALCSKPDFGLFRLQKIFLIFNFYEHKLIKVSLLLCWWRSRDQQKKYRCQASARATGPSVPTRD